MENSKVKERLLTFCKLTNTPKLELAKKLGINASNLMPSSLKYALSSETIVVFLQAYSEISAEWLMRGEGQMFKKSVEDVGISDVINTADHNSTVSFIYNQAHTLSAQKDAAIRQRDETITNLQQTISALQALVNSQQQHIQLLQECASRIPRQYPCSENLAGDAQTPNYQPSISPKIGTKSEHNP